MGKSLRGKECGKGICQRKAGLYYARLGWSCAILSLSTGVPGNRQRTVPMMPTFISYATKQKLKNSVCTLCATPMQRVQSKAECSPKCCKNYSVMPASKQQWIGMFMSQTIRWSMPWRSFRRWETRRPELVPNWCGIA